LIVLDRKYCDQKRQDQGKGKENSHFMFSAGRRLAPSYGGAPNLSTA